MTHKIDYNKIRLFFFDLAGTTVEDNIDGIPLVVAGLQHTFHMLLNINLSIHDINPHRGKGKLDAIKSLLMERYHTDNKSISLLDIAKQSTSPNAFNRAVDELSKQLFKQFTRTLDQLIVSTNHEISGTSELFMYCRANNIKIAVGSGFPHKTVTALISNMKWGHLDYIGSIDTVDGKSRPVCCSIYIIIVYTETKTNVIGH